MSKKKYVVVTTSYRGVFGGYLEKEDGQTVTLSNCRNCIAWSKDMQGFLGLARLGPSSGCKIGIAAPRLKLFGVTCIVECTDMARDSWEDAQW